MTSSTIPFVVVLILNRTDRVRSRLFATISVSTSSFGVEDVFVTLSDSKEWSPGDDLLRAEVGVGTRWLGGNFFASGGGDVVILPPRPVPSPASRTCSLGSESRRWRIPLLPVPQTGSAR